MNKLILLLVATFTLGTAVAQDWSTDVYKYGEEYPGYIVTAAGEKIEGFITYRDRYSMQNNIDFWTDKTNKKTKTKYSTDELKEYLVADKLYHCIHYSGGLLKKPIKGNLVVKEGCIMEYVWYDRAESYMTMQKAAGESDEEFMTRMYPPTTVYLKDGEEDAKTVQDFGIKFAEKMSEWLSDNKELSAKVANKEKGYGMIRILEIIQEYNDNCKKD